MVAKSSSDNLLHGSAAPGLRGVIMAANGFTSTCMAQHGIWNSKLINDMSILQFWRKWWRKVVRVPFYMVVQHLVCEVSWN